jgi:glycine betaine/proline transport system substrate-binding protein
MFALHELVILKEPAYDEAKWVVKQPTDDPQWLENSSAPVAWNTAKLKIHYAASLEKSNPEVAKLLSQVKLDTEAVSKMTFALVVEKKDPAEFAKDWVSKNGSLVDSWLK